jgi:hypothetical protein
MADKAFFKTYKRQKRVHLADELFGMGMQYTNAPLNEGFVKTLINFDAKDKGESLVPRPGLRTEKLGISDVPWTDSMFLSTGKICVKENHKEYYQLIVGDAPETPVENSNLFAGQLHLLTIEGSNIINSVDGVAELLTHTDSVTIPEETHTTFKKPAEAKIHGLNLVNSSVIAKHVGTFAFNNDYYFFKHNEDGGALCRTKFDTDQYITEPVEIREISPREAVMWGYNMLQKTPYTFVNTNNTASMIFSGMLPYSDAAGTKLITTPRINEPVYLRNYYAAPTGINYKITWEWRDPVSDDWTLIKEVSSFSTTGAPNMDAEFSSPTAMVFIRVTATRVGQTIAEQVMTVGFNFNKDAHGTTSNLEPVQYDLTKASGMAYWLNKLVFYGFAEDPTIIIVTDVNDPGYAPYPNNADLFSEPVVHVVNLLNNLLVFTTTKLHILVPDETGMGWSNRLIQSNLDIQPWDVHLIQVVKNMVFFKSGNYYYMVVPSIKLSGELVIAPISKNIEELFDNFETVVKKCVELVYYYRDELELVHYYNYLDFEDVHNTYVFKTTHGVYLNFVLLYNTIGRTWRIYMYESEYAHIPFSHDATKKGTLMSLVSINDLTGVQFLRYSDVSKKDFYIPQGPSLLEAIESFETKHTFKNYQLLDTGYREHATDFKKRYRELQIKIHNIDPESLTFYTLFAIDGVLRKGMFRYTTQHNVDPEDPDFGLLMLDRELIDPMFLPGTTKLAEFEDELDRWQLDVSAFPDITFWKARIPVSGKGYSPQMMFISQNETHYEILNVSWVFRPLYAR